MDYPMVMRVEMNKMKSLDRLSTRFFFPIRWSNFCLLSSSLLMLMLMMTMTKEGHEERENVHQSMKINVRWSLVMIEENIHRLDHLKGIEENYFLQMYSFLHENSIENLENYSFCFLKWNLEEMFFEFVVVVEKKIVRSLLMLMLKEELIGDEMFSMKLKNVSIDNYQ